MKTDNVFLAGISFDENPFVDETPEEVKLYDLSGNEVTADAVK